MLCAAAVACGLEVKSDFPATAVPLATPILYRSWWQIVEQCSGRKRPIDAVRWYHVKPGELTIRGETAAGAWFVDGNRIVLTAGTLREGPLVRHEMLHAILETGDHPKEFFQQRCGAELACGGECLEKSILPNAHRLSLEQLDVSVALYPPVPSVGALDGRVTAIVTVRNPATGNAYVSAGQFDQPLCAVGVRIEAVDEPQWTKWVCGWIPFTDDARLYLRPNEARRLVLDFDIRTRIATGSFHVGGITVSSILNDSFRKSIITRVEP